MSFGALGPLKDGRYKEHIKFQGKAKNLKFV